ncbi:flagellar motor protein MotB [Conexibacter sp. SYSU D00693]|uniref:flagellar motor protein MotB n=1 Tax=Conexibacter sp. SYSU D00693 TaxID=2812560 RepID=UPI00196B9A4C|nr:flagellar motor protein MotB [Conexibacter sp. SYSU D00693]
MAAGRRHKGGGHDDHEEHVDEAWLVSYADMMTLLVALFMVLFSISSVNTSKFESLQRSMQEAFSGKIFPGGQGLRQTGGDDQSTKLGSSSAPPSFAPVQERKGDVGRKREERQLQQLKKQVDAAARDLGLQNKVKARMSKDGLRVRILTDDLLFGSGSATPNPQAAPLLAKLGTLLSREAQHPVVVEGHTDPVPTGGSGFTSNWELSTARATAVLHAFTKTGVSQRRLTAAGRAYLDPITSNDTAAGRSLNRRVEILLPRTARTP